MISSELTNLSPAAASSGQSKNEKWKRNNTVFRIQAEDDHFDRIDFEGNNFGRFNLKKK